jgi:hypothetical protein
MSHDAPDLDTFAVGQTRARYAENQEIARANRALRAELNDAQADLEQVRRRLGIYEALDASVIAPPAWMAPTKQTAKHHAIPTLLLTDIHWGERVDPAEINGVNKYDRTIAALRLRRVAETTTKLCRDYLSGVKYDGLTLLLGGDLVSGDIHEELRETNVEATTESVVGVLELLVAGTRMLTETFGKVHVAAVVGNHGRTTRKPRSKKRAADSYDGLVYQLMARELRSDPRITMQVATGADAHFSVYHQRYCLTHGDQFRGGSGISGMLAPLMLGVHRKRRRDATAGSPWDTMVLGHFHQSHFSREMIVGGSVIGYNEYAHTCNLPMEEPMAAMWLTTPERGITAYMPVHAMDRAAEGW